MASSGSSNLLVMVIFIALLGTVGYFGVTASGRRKLKAFIDKIQGEKNGNDYYNAEYPFGTPRITPLGPAKETYTVGELFDIVYGVAESKEKRKEVREWFEDYGEDMDKLQEIYDKYYGTNNPIFNY